MRASLFVLLLSALGSSVNAIPASDGNRAPRGLVAARQPTRIRAPRAAPPNFAHIVPRAKPVVKYDDRRSYVPRAKPSDGGDGNSQRRRNVVPRAKPSDGGDGNSQRRRNVVPRAKPTDGGDGNSQRRNYVPRGKTTSEKANNRRNYGSRAQPAVDGIHRARRRLQQGQGVIGAGLGWDQCPAPLEACPVRGANDADDFECVDLWSDLDSCGGCAAEDSACVFSFSFFV